MRKWPEITEPLLRERQAMSDEQFFEYLAGLLGQVGPRTFDEAHYQQAIGYPWWRPPGSCLISGAEIGEVDDALVSEFLHADGRIPLLAYGANGSPERLALKFAHLYEEHQRALILAGDLDGFDVAATAQGPWFSSMPATLVESPGTRVRVAVLFVTPIQFTTLWWTELSYVIGALEGVRVDLDVAAEPVERVIAFVSRFGAFCPTGQPAVMAAIAAEDRRWPAFTQEAVLAAAAHLTLGADATARDVVRAAYERPTEFLAKHFATLQAAARPFASPLWTEMPV